LLLAVAFFNCRHEYREGRERVELLATVAGSCCTASASVASEAGGLHLYSRGLSVAATLKKMGQVNATLDLRACCPAPASVVVVAASASSTSRWSSSTGCHCR